MIILLTTDHNSFGVSTILISLTYLFLVDWDTSFAIYINPFPLCGCECCLVAALALLFFEIYKGVFYVQEIWLSLYTGQPFIVSFQWTIIVSSRPYSQMVSRESRKFSPLNFYPRKGIEPGTFVLVTTTPRLSISQFFVC